MKCVGYLKNGHPCRFPAARNGDYCFQHDPSPEGARRRREARIKGGRNRRKYAMRYIQLIRLDTLADCDLLINRTINAMLEQHLDIYSGLVMSFAAWVKVLSVASIKGYDVSARGAKWGRKTERDAFKMLSRIAERSIRHIEKIKPEAIRAIDTLHEQIVAQRRKQIYRNCQERQCRPRGNVKKGVKNPHRPYADDLRRLLR